MPRTYIPRGKKQFKKYDPAIIEQAVAEYLNEHRPLSVIAEKYNMNKSVLQRHSTRFMKKQGGQTILSSETESRFITYINICSEWGYPLEPLDLRFLVKTHLDKIGRVEKRFRNNLPGPDFVRGFLNRHKNNICSKMNENSKRNGATSVTPEILQHYFDNLKKTLHSVAPENIINYDEVNMSDDLGRRQMVFKRKSKYPERAMAHTKGFISIMMACTTSGDLLPPYVVYKADNICDTWTQDGPNGTCYNKSQSGWFDAVTFEDWVKTIAVPYFEGKTGKKCNNLSSHLSIDLIKFCNDNDIDFVFLPANSSHLTQPLSISFFRQMEIAWRNIILQWKEQNSANKVPNECFPKLFSKLMEIIGQNAAEDISSGFRKSGINPLDPSQVLLRFSPNVKDEFSEESLLALTFETESTHDSEIKGEMDADIDIKEEDSEFNAASYNNTGSGVVKEVEESLQNIPVDLQSDVLDSIEINHIKSIQYRP